MYTALLITTKKHKAERADQDYFMQSIEQKPLFMYSVETFKKLNFEIVMVVQKNELEQLSELNDSSIKLVLGGKNYAESIKKGLKEVQTPYVFVHDIHRPLLDVDSILEMQDQLSYHDAVLLGQPVSGHLKKMQNQDLLAVEETDYFFAISPQAFLTEKIRYAFLRSRGTYDDDISLYQAFYPNEKIQIILSEKTNIEIVYPHDIAALEAILKQGGKKK